MFTADESMGAHNPPYEQAALTNPSSSPTRSVGLRQRRRPLGPSTVTSGSVNFISGGVDFGDGTPLSGQLSRLCSRTTPRRATTADPDGAFSFMISPSATTTYQVAGSGRARPDLALQHHQTVTIAGMPTTITISSRRATSRQQAVHPERSRHPARSHRPEHARDVKKPGSSHFSYSSARTFYNCGGNAAWQYKYTPLVTGTYHSGRSGTVTSFAPSQSGLVSVFVH